MYFGRSARILCALFVALGALGATAALAAGTPVSWGTAIEAPGTAALNTGGNAEITSVSCGGTSACGAGGIYHDANGNPHAFIQNSAGSSWSEAIPVSGTEAAPQSELLTVSCPDTTYCGAGGYYIDTDGAQHAFVLEGSNGVWGTAADVQAAAGLTLGGSPVVNSISCASVGNCSAGGTYDDGGLQQAFVVTEKNGVWGNAIAVPGITTLNYAYATLTSLSCASAGNCSAGGAYYDGTGARQAYVAIEKAGVWKKAIKVPGIAAMNNGGDSETLSISCGSTANCSAGGYFTDSTGFRGTFVSTEKAGVWKKAIKVPGLPSVTADGRVSSVSCRGASSCTAGGYYTSNGLYTAFTVSEKQGVWGKAHSMGMGTYHSAVTSVSCSSAGNCAAVGYFYDNTGEEPFIVAQRNGNWVSGGPVPGVSDLNAGGYAAPSVVSCAKAGGCAIGGYFTDVTNARQAFLTAP
jgi:hypothetical protein